MDQATSAGEGGSRSLGEVYHYLIFVRGGSQKKNNAQNILKHILVWNLEIW